MKINDIEDTQARKTMTIIRANIYLTKVMVIVIASFAIWRSIVGKSPFAVFWIFAAFAFVCLIWMPFFTTRQMEKLEKKSISAVRDCYDYYYKKAKTPKRKNMILLVKSKCSLILGDYVQSLQSLEQIQKERIPLNYLGSYYMQLAMVKRLLGDDEGYQQNYIAYQNVTNEKSPDVERRMRLLNSENPTDALQLITLRESFRKNRKILAWILSFAIFLIVVALYTQVIRLMPSGYEYREWVDIIGYLCMRGGIFFYATLFLVKIYRSMNRDSNQSFVRVMSTLVLVVCIIIGVLMLLLLGLADMTSFKSEALQKDGTLYIRQQNFLDPEIHYVCEKEGLLFRKVLYYEDNDQGESFQDSGNKSNQSTNKNNNGMENKDATKDTRSTDNNNAVENKNNRVNSNTTDIKQNLADLHLSKDEEHIVKDYEAIYNYAYIKTDSQPQYQVSAKGALYAVLGEYPYTGSSYAGTAVKAEKRLVFDRDSKNKMYDLVVCYEDYYDAAGNKLDDSAILEFYAVSHDARKVIAADKHAWADTGSKEYKDAIGE